MTITVVVASYRYSLFLSRALESVFYQTRKPDEVIVANDDPQDDFLCRAITGSYKAMYMSRKERMGIVGNFNDVLSNYVCTDKVMFLGADNWLRPDAIERMEANDSDIVSSDIALVGTEVGEFRKGLNTEYIDGYHVWRFKPGNIKTGNYIHGSSLYDAHLARAVGGYEANPKGKHTEEDWMLWRKMLKAGAKHVHVPEPLLYYNRHKANFNQ